VGRGMKPIMIDFSESSPSVTWLSVLDPNNIHYIENILRKVIDSMKNSGDEISVIETTQVVWDAYETALRNKGDGFKLYRAVTFHDVLTFDGIDIVVNPKVPDGFMHAMNFESDWWESFIDSHKIGTLKGLPSEYGDLSA